MKLSAIDDIARDDTITIRKIVCRNVGAIDGDMIQMSTAFMTDPEHAVRIVLYARDEGGEFVQRNVVYVDAEDIALVFGDITNP